MGRHAAGDGAGVDPIVAAALRARPTSGQASTPRHGPQARQLTGSDGEGDLGWPGEPREGTGLGWPVDAGTGPSAGEPGLSLVAGQPPSVRRGWRRVFGRRAA